MTPHADYIFRGGRWVDSPRSLRPLPSEKCAGGAGVFILTAIALSTLTALRALHLADLEGNTQNGTGFSIVVHTLIISEDAPPFVSLTLSRRCSVVCIAIDTPYYPCGGFSCDCTGKIEFLVPAASRLAHIPWCVPRNLILAQQFWCMRLWSFLHI